MSLAKLTSISTKTLSLLLERQRLQTLPSFSNPLTDDSPNGSTSNSLHLPQIKKNLAQLRTGIKELERSGDGGEAVALLKNQYERMRGMLGNDANGIPALDEDESPTPRPSSIASPSIQSQTSVYATPASSVATPLAPSPAPMPSIGLTASSVVSKQDSAAAARFLSSTSTFSATSHSRNGSDSVFVPYTDDPSGKTPPRIAEDGSGEGDTGILLQQQRFIMDEQDQRLDQLSHSINRQHHISLQINDELEVHQGLLEELDEGIDRTSGRLGTARRKLDRVAKGIKENSSVFAIGVLIFVLLILIIVLKT
ncbi:hypothetical protein NMY22_g4152 [Coprinellus aureogranulatus]|nr:hypothetical protein NMY22_g4152 [Coprinellus aureogranulatus]